MIRQKAYSALFVSMLITLLLAGKSSPAETTLPNPVLVATGVEDYEQNGEAWRLYTFCVFNRSAYPEEMFEPAPDLPPCGLNKSSSRSWVNLFGKDGKSLYGFCGLKSSREMRNLHFSLPKGQTPPGAVYVVIHDRKLNVRLQSSAVSATDAP